MKKEVAVAYKNATRAMLTDNFAGFALEDPDDVFYRESVEYLEEIREALIRIVKDNPTSAGFIVRNRYGETYNHPKSLQFRADLQRGKYPVFQGMTRRDIIFAVLKAARYIRVRPDCSYPLQNPSSTSARVTYEMTGIVRGVKMYLRIRTCKSGNTIQTDLHESDF